MNLRPFLLKAGATVLSLGATVASAAYVTAHLKNPDAPLQPTVLTSSSQPFTVGPSVRPTDAPPVTSTYAS